MNTVARTESQGQLSELPRTTDGGILAVIARAASDPSVDVDKLSRLLDMHERISAQQSEQAFNVAMNAAQKDMRPISADANNPQTRSKYASFAKLDSALRPIYTKHGFSLSFDEGDSPKPDHVRVLCYVAHTSGHTKTYRRDMPADGKGAKGGDVMTKTHAAGAAGSYGARYILKGIFNVSVGEEDTDGNDPECITEPQSVTLNDLIESTGTNREKFFEYFKITSLGEMAAKDYLRALSLLKQKAKS